MTSAILLALAAIAGFIGNDWRLKAWGPFPAGAYTRGWWGWLVVAVLLVGAAWGAKCGGTP